MIQNRKSQSRSFLSFLTLTVTLCLSALAFGDPAQPGAPAPAPIATAPAIPTPAPTNPPAPAATAPAPVRREEDEPGAPGNPQAAKPSIFDRAAAMLKGKEGVAAEIAMHRKRATDAEAALATANQTIAAQSAELADLRAGRKRLEDAVATMETERTDVAGIVASLGVPAATLPPAAPVEQAGESTEGLLASFRSEQDPGKKAELFAKWQAKRDAQASN